jgi:hypothetical protein
MSANKDEAGKHRSERGGPPKQANKEHIMPQPDPKKSPTQEPFDPGHDQRRSDDEKRSLKH